MENETLMKKIAQTDCRVSLAMQSVGLMFLLKNVFQMRWN